MNIIISSGDKIYYPTLKPWDHTPHFVNKYDKDVLYIQRYPANWDQIEKNMKSLFEYGNNRTSGFCVNHVITCLNFHHINEFLMYFYRFSKMNNRKVNSIVKKIMYKKK